MATDLQTIESYWSLEEAEIARGFLASEGIRCQLDGRAIAANFWHLNVATGGVRLRTLQQDADRATALLHGIEHHDQFGPDDTEDFWPQEDQTIEGDGRLTRTRPTSEVEDSQNSLSIEDSDAGECGGVLDSLRRQKWAIILAFIVLIVTGAV